MTVRRVFRFLFRGDGVFERLKERILVLLIPSLAAIVRRYTHTEVSQLGKYFRLWEKEDVHITPVHFYSPNPDTRALPDELWERQSTMVGVELNEAAQLELLRDVFPLYRTEYDLFPSAPTEVPHEFHFNNGMFDGTDALALYCLIRHFRPKTIIEVGAGFSSRISAVAALRNGDTQLICIEPFPPPLFEEGFPGLTRLIREPVQQVGLSLFEQLAENDILFIDSSHVVKCGSDVTYLYLEVLPRLRPGVMIHIHDVFLPGEMPKELLKDLGLFWNEQYLLRAFLTFNSEFEVLFAGAYMGDHREAEMRATFPHAKPFWGGGSFWIRRKRTMT